MPNFECRTDEAHPSHALTREIRVLATLSTPTPYMTGRAGQGRAEHSPGEDGILTSETTRFTGKFRRCSRMQAMLQTSQHLRSLIHLKVSAPVPCNFKGFTGKLSKSSDMIQDTVISNAMSSMFASLPVLFCWSSMLAFGCTAKMQLYLTSRAPQVTES